MQVLIMTLSDQLRRAASPLYCGIGLIAAGCILLLASVTDGSTSPFPTVERVNLGRLRAPALVPVRHVLRNRSQWNVVIGEVLTSCGCLNPIVHPNTVKPGQTATIEATLNLTGRRGKVSPEILLTYRSGDSEDVSNSEERWRVCKIQLAAEVLTDLSATPSVVEFSSGARQPQSARFRISSATSTTVSVTDVKSSRNFVAVDIDPTDPQLVSVTFLPDLYFPEAGQANVYVTASSVRDALITVPVRITAKP